jgi:hypothetical protein
MTRYVALPASPDLASDIQSRACPRVDPSGKKQLGILDTRSVCLRTLRRLEICSADLPRCVFETAVTRESS